MKIVLNSEQKRVVAQKIAEVIYEEMLRKTNEKISHSKDLVRKTKGNKYGG